MLPENYRNKVLRQDVMEVLRALPGNSLDMIYGDPDYNVGVKYAGQSYTKKWDAYIAWYGALATECMRVLKPDGNAFFINYPKQNAYLRVQHLDRLAQMSGGDVRDYVWVYNSNVGHSPRRFTTAHRSILHATKSRHNRFYKSQVAQPYKNPDDRRIRERIANGHKGRMPYSWLQYQLVKNVSRDKTFHACQIPLRLVRLLMNASTRKGDSIFILFGGSGSEICLAQKLERQFLSCEINRRYYDMICDRLRHRGHVQEKYRLASSRKRPASEPRIFDSGTQAQRETWRPFASP